MPTANIRIITVPRHKKCVASIKALKAIYKRKMYSSKNNYYTEHHYNAEYNADDEYKTGNVFRHTFWNHIEHIWKDENTKWVASDEPGPLGFTGVMSCTLWDYDATLYIKVFKTVPDEKK